ncbi:hypothetical protein IGI04_015723 [Brassica rapa subsp. trilocularis]|uniref:Pentatricopeptide repeat-containing protein n=1 Tax=Brassica rapa subsp. trilocularis TaxID=1813537 RepID=A0ABQ7MQX6_BRACM|nr:hypothetical protein IGI04_015723 [Brassica rapa subsp. trilocularis]
MWRGRDTVKKCMSWRLQGAYAYLPDLVWFHRQRESRGSIIKKEEESVDGGDVHYSNLDRRVVKRWRSDLYSKVLASGIVPDEVLFVVLVDGLSKKGRFVKASKMLEELKKRDDATLTVLTYTTVIGGHYREGNLDKTF